MLAKDYRTRCNLDAVVEDDWVTSEGSEPLFEDDDSFGSSPAYSDFSDGLMAEDGVTPVLKALIIDNSISKRHMLVLQLNLVRQVMCKCAANDHSAVDIITAAQENCPEANFDLVFCELVLPGAEGWDTVEWVRQSGYTGRIVGVLRGSEDINMYAYATQGCHAVLRRPIPTREIRQLFLDMDADSSSQRAVTMTSESLQRLSISATALATQEEVEAAIRRVESHYQFTPDQASTPIAVEEEEEPEPVMEDFQKFRSVKSNRGPFFSVDDEEEEERERGDKQQANRRGSARCVITLFICL
jgi:CheY-like chemotaxis protein